jgi:anti-sigma factor RsiW
VLCPESLRVQAYVDGEVDALTSTDIERHLEHCPECQQLRADIDELRTTLRRDVPTVEVPPALRRRVLQALDAEAETDSAQPKQLGRSQRRPQSFWMGAFGGFATAAAMAALAFFVVAPPLRNPVVDEVLGAHVSSLMSSHLIDVVSTDQHTVKPWFAGHTDVSPAVADFASQGYKLIGGRIDYLRQQRAAVVVYQHGPHIINVFCWSVSSGSLPTNSTRNGYHLAFWRSGDLAYAAVSDTGWGELSRLERLLQGLEAGTALPK